MELLEVYVQGVSRFVTPFKFALKNGYTVIYGGNETGKSALAHILVATFDAAHAAAVAPTLQPPTQSESRYGCLFAHGETRYRLLRTLGGQLNLARLNPATQKFELIAKDENALTAFFQDVLDLPLDGLYARLALVTKEGLVPVGATNQPVSVSATAFADVAVEGEAFGGAQDIESQIKQLQRELQILSSVSELEARVDNLHNKKYEIETSLGKYKDIAKQIELTEKRQQELGPLDKMTPEIEGRLKNLEKAEQYQAQRLAALDQEIKGLEQQLDLLEPKLKRKFQKDPFFIAGAVLALLGLGLPFVTKLYVLSLLGFGALGWLGFLVFMMYPKLQAQYAEVDAAYRKKCAEEERVKKEFDAQMAIIKDLVKVLKVIDAKDLLELLKEYRELKQKVVELTQARESLVQLVGSEQKLVAELKKTEAEIALFEEELRNAGAITHDANQIRAEIQRLEAIRDGRSAAPTPATTVTSPPVANGPAFDVLFEMAARAARRDWAELQPIFQDKLNAYLRALAPNRYGPAEVNGDTVQLTRAEFGGQRVEWGRLSEGARDTIFAAARLALLEVVAASRPFPVIFDDPFTALDDQRQAIVAKMLKRLSGMMPVVHLASQKGFLALADSRVELK